MAGFFRNGWQVYPGIYIKGKSYGLYVPESLVPKVKKLIDNWKELKETVEKLTDLNAKLIKKRKI